MNSLQATERVLLKEHATELYLQVRTLHSLNSRLDKIEMDIHADLLVVADC